MNIILGVCAPLAVIGVVILLVLRPWVDRSRSGARWEHARLSRRHKREWRRFKRANKGLKGYSPDDSDDVREDQL